MGDTMKAAIYTRVSSDEQIEGFSLSGQLTELQSYCIKNNIEIYNSYSDEGISGTKEDRPAFQKMITDAEKKLFDVILVHKFDRFARKVEISQRIKSRLKKANVNVISITEPIEDSPIGFFQEGLLELLSEYFIKNLSNEIKKGQKQRAMEGHHHGVVPYGYRTKDGLAYIIEDEAKVVREVYDLYLQGWGYSKIAKHLNYSDIKTMTGKQWQHHQIYRILQNPVYCGYVVLGGKQYESKSPPIISREIFEEAKRDRGIKGERYTYRANHQNNFLLLGLLKCGECGSCMRICKGGKNWTAYGCNYALRYNGDDKCNFRKHFNAKKTNKRVLEDLERISNDTSIEIKTKTKVNISDIIGNYSTKIQIELKRAKEAYIAGVFELEEYSQIRTKLEKELKEISSSTPSQISQEDPREKIKKAMILFYSFPEDDIVNRKKALRTIIEYISIGRNGIDIWIL